MRHQRGDQRFVANKAIGVWAHWQSQATIDSGTGLPKAEPVERRKRAANEDSGHGVSDDPAEADAFADDSDVFDLEDAIADDDEQYLPPSYRYLATLKFDAEQAATSKPASSWWVRRRRTLLLSLLLCATIAALVAVLHTLRHRDVDTSSPAAQVAAFAAPSDERSRQNHSAPRQQVVSKAAAAGDSADASAEMARGQAVAVQPTGNPTDAPLSHGTHDRRAAVTVPDPPSSRPGAVHFSTRDGAIVVPTLIRSRHATIQTPLLFDTGATFTTLNSKLLQQLKLAVSDEDPQTTMQTAAGPVTRGLKIVEQIAVGDATVAGGLTVSQCDDCSRSGVGGLLGLNFSRHFRVTIDHQGSQAHLRAAYQTL